MPAVTPGLRFRVRANRAFLGRATRFLAAGAGVRAGLAFRAGWLFVPGRPVIANDRNSLSRWHTAIAIMVVLGSHPVTCGRVVHKLVDNRS